MTHTDPKAEFGAFAVALAAYMNSETADYSVTPEEFYQRLTGSLIDDSAEEFLALIRSALDSVRAGKTTEEFIVSQGWRKGISGYVYQTVPAVIHAWFRHPNDFREGILEIIRCGGDTDTTAAILGGILGARTGKTGIPQDLLDRLIEWPRSAAWMERVGERLADCMEHGTSGQPLHLFVPGVLLRNILFLVVVLLHGFRRLLPPY
jgi:ADP-ribosylglycohydrolase